MTAIRAHLDRNQKPTSWTVPLYLLAAVIVALVASLVMGGWS